VSLDGPETPHAATSSGSVANQVRPRNLMTQSIGGAVSERNVTTGCAPSAAVRFLYLPTHTTHKVPRLVRQRRLEIQKSDFRVIEPVVTRQTRDRLSNLSADGSDAWEPGRVNMTAIDLTRTAYGVLSVDRRRSRRRAASSAADLRPVA